MAQTVRIEGIRAQGRHGAREGEQDAAQPFVVDLEMDVSANEDDLDTTADYRTVVTEVRTVIEQESYRIIETLAERLANRVAEMPNVASCHVWVHKPAAAERLGIGDVSAEATAHR